MNDDAAAATVAAEPARPERWWSLPSRAPSGWPHAVCFLLVGLLAVAARLVFIEDPGLSDDTAYYRAASQVAEGDWSSVLRPNYLPKRLGIILPTALAIRAFGIGQVSYYLLPMAMAFLEAGFIYLIGSRLANRLVGLAASGIAVLLPLSLLSGSLLLPDAFNDTCMAGAFWALLRAADTPGQRRGRHWLWGAAAGGFVLLGYMMRETGLFMAPVVLVVGLWARRWRAVVASAAVFLAGTGAEAILYAALAGDPLARLHSLSTTYVAGVAGTHLLKATSLWEMTTRHIDELGNDWLNRLWVCVTAAASLPAMIFTRDRRRRWLVMYFWIVMLLLHYAVISFHPLRPLLDARGKFLVLAVAPGALMLAILGGQTVRLARRLRAWLPAALFIGGVTAMLLFFLKADVKEREFRYFRGGYAEELTRRISAEARRVSAETERCPLRQILAPAHENLVLTMFGYRETVPLNVLAENMDPLDTPAGTLLVMDCERLASWDRDSADGILQPLPSGRKRTALVADPPANWQLLAVVRLHDKDRMYLYRVYDPRTGYSCMTPVPWWPTWERNRDAPPPAGYHCRPGPLGYAGNARWTPDARGGPDAVKLDVRKGRYYYCYNGDQPDYENPPDGSQPMTPGAWYALRFRARSHWNPGTADERTVNVFLYTWPRPNSDLLTRLTSRWPQSHRQDLGKPDEWSWCLMGFEAGQSIQKVRWAWTPNGPGPSVDFADVQLYECHEPRPVAAAPATTRPATTATPGD